MPYVKGGVSGGKGGRSGEAWQESSEGRSCPGRQHRGSHAYHLRPIRRFDRELQHSDGSVSLFRISSQAENTCCVGLVENVELMVKVRLSRSRGK